MAQDKTAQNAVRGTRLTAELAAYSLSKEAPNLEGRKPVTGYAIDSADPAEPMDRDDAIAVEYRQDPVLGRLTLLHVTVADVASLLPRSQEHEPNPRLAALDGQARDMAATKYFSHGSRPMFPRRLQDRMSLEHHKERPGLTVSITYDDHGNRIHTQFSRTRIKAACKSYREASHDIQDGSSPPNPVQRIALLAKLLLKGRPGETPLPYYDEASGMYLDAEGQARHISAESSTSYMAVQGCMVAANEAVAELMQHSPFLFRNQFGTQDGQPVPFQKDMKLRKDAISGGIYGETCMGHYGLNRSAYCHATSPIRRYADLANQRMQHWAIDVVEAVVDAAAGAPGKMHPGWDKERLSIAVWDQAKRLLGALTEYHETVRGRARVAPQRQLEAVLQDILMPVLGGSVRCDVAVQQAMRGLEALAVPYTRKELAQLSLELNEKQRKPAPTRTYDEMMTATLDMLFLPIKPDESGFRPKLEHIQEAVRRRRPHTFAKLLEAAARRGDIDSFFAGEVSRRLKSPDDKDELVHNLHLLLVEAQKHSDSHWDALRREAFQMLKDDCELAQRVFDHLHAQHKPPKVFVLETSLVDKDRANYPAALVVLNHEGVDYSAPVLDTGDTPEAARVGAILTFFRHYGALAPHEEQYTPRLIDLALGRARVKKTERLAFLKKMCGREFTIEEQVTPLPSQPEKADIVLRLIRKEDGETLEKSRFGWTEFSADYLDKCAKDMIEDRRFVDMLSATELMLEMPAGAPLVFTREGGPGGIDRRGGAAPSK